MSDVYTSQPLVVRPWCNHAATTVGYINDKGHFTPLADCNLGPGYAVDYEPLARLLASAPDLLAERDKLKALNADLVAALNHQIEATHALLEWAIEVSDEYLDGEPGTRAELVADMSRAREHAAQARAALAKNKETT